MVETILVVAAVLATFGAIWLMARIGVDVWRWARAQARFVPIVPPNPEDIPPYRPYSDGRWWTIYIATDPGPLPPPRGAEAVATPRATRKPDVAPPGVRARELIAA